MMVRLVVSAPDGEMLSQFTEPLCTDELAVKLVAVVAFTVRVCDAGEELFNVPLKVSELGVTRQRAGG